MSTAILHSLEAGVLRVTLCRPEKLNALDRSGVAAFQTLLDAHHARPEVRCLLLTGAGDRAFCAGADLAEFAASPEASASFIAAGQALTRTLDAYPVPTIAVLNGTARGGGFEIALACHLRLGCERSSVALPEVRLGLLPGWGGTGRLTRLCGPATALDLMLTGRLAQPDEALRMGILSSLHPSQELSSVGDALAAEIAHLPGDAIGEVLAAVRRAVSSASELEREEAAAFGRLQATAASQALVKAFLTRKKS